MNYFKGVCKGIIDNQIIFATDDEDVLHYFKEHIGTPLKIEAKKWSDKRSLAQNALYWACVHELAKVTRLGADQIHLMMLRQTQKPETLEIRKESVNAFKEQWRTFEIIKENEETVIINAYFGSHLMDKDEFSHLLDVVLAEMEDCDIAPPSRQMKEYLDALQN